VCSVVENECVLRSRRRGIAAAPPSGGEWEPVVVSPRAAERRQRPDDRDARGRCPWTGSHRNGRDGGRRNGRHGWWHHSEATNLSTRVLLQVNAFFDHRPQAADGFLDGAALPLQNARLGFRPPNDGRGRPVSFIFAVSPTNGCASGTGPQLTPPASTGMMTSAALLAVASAHDSAPR
jgi:hypothetical protein